MFDGLRRVSCRSRLLADMIRPVTYVQDPEVTQKSGPLFGENEVE